MKNSQQAPRRMEFRVIKKSQVFETSICNRQINTYLIYHRTELNSLSISIWQESNLTKKKKKKKNFYVCSDCGDELTVSREGRKESEKKNADHWPVQRCWSFDRRSKSMSRYTVAGSRPLLRSYVRSVCACMVVGSSRDAAESSWSECTPFFVIFGRTWWCVNSFRVEIFGDHGEKVSRRRDWESKKLGVTRDVTKLRRSWRDGEWPFRMACTSPHHFSTRIWNTERGVLGCRCFFCPVLSHGKNVLLISTTARRVTSPDYNYTLCLCLEPFSPSNNHVFFSFLFFTVTRSAFFFEPCTEFKVL